MNLETDNWPDHMAMSSTTTTNDNNLISRRLYEGKKAFSKDGVSLSILIDHIQWKHTSDDRGHRTQPYMEICATNDSHHLSRLIVSARKVFRMIGASEEEKEKKKVLSKGGIMNEAEDDVHKQKLLESSDFAKDLAASYLYNRLSIVLDTNDTTKFSLKLSPLASDMINGTTKLDLELDHPSDSIHHDRMYNTGDHDNTSFALHKPDSLYVHRRPSSPVKRQISSTTAFNSNGNNTQTTLIPSHPIKQKDKQKEKDKISDKGQTSEKSKQKVNVRDYPFHQFTKWKDGTLPSTPRRGVHHYQSNQSDQQFHHVLCVALNG